MTQTPPDAGSYEGDEPPRDSSIPPPQRYGETSGQPPAPARPPQPAAPASDEPTTADRMVAVSGPVAVILFLVFGFAFDGWAWAWIVFLIPGVLYQWKSAGRKR